MVDATKIEQDFDNQFTRQFGFPKERPSTKIKSYLAENVQDFIKASPMLVMATSDGQGNCDASPKGGKPGFVKILDDSRIIIPDVAGNKLFQSYLNITENPKIGLVFFIPGVRRTVRVNGTANIVSGEELDRLNVEMEVFNPDENARILQGIVVDVEEAYGHCPRALAFSDFWDEGKISENRGEPRRA
jgi:hypothetical protein